MAEFSLPPAWMLPSFIAGDLILFAYCFWLIGIHWNDAYRKQQNEFQTSELLSCRLWISVWLMLCVPMLGLAFISAGIVTLLSSQLTGPLAAATIAERFLEMALLSQLIGGIVIPSGFFVMIVAVAVAKVCVAWCGRTAAPNPK